MRWEFIALVLITATADVAETDVSCKRIRKVPRSFEGEQPSPGAYEIVLVATHGSAKGQKVSGRLELRQAKRSDTSPRTGEQAQDRDLSTTPLYGWIDAELEALAAPLCSEPPHPRPDSTDPVYPGVLLHIVRWEGRPDFTPVLTVGALGNLRDGKHWVDGCGIGLFVRRMDDRSFYGDWEPWATVQPERGYFCAWRQ